MWHCERCQSILKVIHNFTELKQYLTVFEWSEYRPIQLKSNASIFIFNIFIIRLLEIKIFEFISLKFFYRLIDIFEENLEFLFWRKNLLQRWIKSIDVIFLLIHYYCSFIFFIYLQIWKSIIKIYNIFWKGLAVKCQELLWHLTEEKMNFWTEN